MKNLFTVFIVVLTLFAFVGCCGKPNSYKKQRPARGDNFPFGYNPGYYGFGANFESSLDKLDRTSEDSAMHFFGY
jgi:hypothetical protein